MRPETVRVVIGGYEFVEIESMELVSDLYDPAGAFRFTLGRRVSATAGSRCVVYINRQLELTGTVDRIEESEDESSHSWTVSGKSLIGMIERTCVTSWGNPPSTLAQAAEKYLSEIPMVNELPWTIDGEDRSVSHARLDVGDTAFKLLNEFAQNRGLLLWAKADGSIVFGKAAGKGEPEYHLDSSLIKKRRRVEDVAALHSEIWIVSDSDEGHRTHVARNPAVTTKTPFAAAYNGHDSKGMERQAQEYLRQEKLQAFQLEYTVAGFSLDGKNWAINKLVSVDDERFGLEDTYLLRSRTFRYDRSSGSTTSLVLCPVLAEDVFKAYPKSKKKKADAW